MDISKTLEKLLPEISEVEKWVEAEYQHYFSAYYKGEAELYAKLKSQETSSSSVPIITDAELEWILTSLPLELFSVAEQLNKLKTKQEVIKLHVKEVEDDYIADPSLSGLSLSARKEKAASDTKEDKFLISVYSTLAERVEREISFSRELIMSAKKIWDSRRSSEPAVPVVSSPSDLPEYNVQKYIK